MANKALLIGINNYESIGDLRGCVNDITNLRHLLMRYFGFQAENISLLADRSAVKERIKKRIAWLFDAAEKDDQLVLHFSGHGSYIRDLDGDEETRALRDHVDELICLYDMDWRERDSYMIDDEIGRQLRELPSGAKLTVVLDCCHSGTGTRDVGIAPPPDLAPPVEAMNRDVDWGLRHGGRSSASSGGLDWGGHGTQLVSQPRFVAPPIDIELRGDERNPPPRARFCRSGDQAEMNHILLAGCRDDQTSADAYLGGMYNGAFTYNLCKTVREANGQISYRDLMGQVQHALRYNGFSQLPQLGGLAEDRSFLS